MIGGKYCLCLYLYTYMENVLFTFVQPQNFQGYLKPPLLPLKADNLIGFQR